VFYDPLKLFFIKGLTMELTFLNLVDIYTLHTVTLSIY